MVRKVNKLWVVNSKNRCPSYSGWCEGIKLSNGTLYFVYLG